MVSSAAAATSDLFAQPPAHLTRPQLIDRIIAINPSASEQFLARFEDRQLSGYLDHLHAVQEPRGGTAARWVRPADSPAIVARIPRD
jgi:hypothetical protein